MLHYNLYDAKKPSETVLILLHGFISDSSTFEQHIDRLSETMKVVTIDLPGHGQDNSSMEQIWDFEWISHQLHKVVNTLKEKHTILHGYSMGARVALYYACHHTSDLSGLILESGSPGIQEEMLREERIQVDAARARVLELAPLETFVNDWEQLPLFQSQRFLSDIEKQRIRHMRLRQSPSRLAKALRDYGTGIMPNLWNELNILQIPVQLIVGEWDEKFVSIAQKMKEQLPYARLEIVSQVGHTVHVEDVVKFDTIALAFINGLNKEANHGKTMGDIKRI
ncbi:2-succinyl-6-hydroxy-2,4-cyclohexadiene-1-carboxylate synthase [Staphylococcus hyicus]|uniref:Putative 2-succinyl-6-hydroxy-2,4-cyclohexadiene-1-carboxylate synthase n=1 Tax=Staphylococcus hyicus TaxID=1284 RepID=A0A2T4R4P5_STAHY|nr:2-succinyl-6-hydroxy-2,4-cyclohexadiene-1-carboxylate synthase [Staphylococcus hyicus]MDP4447535.1 2-succinyl-6-hydroxy-2,4-cyclohexadiene-1-carboxylate synthase [Staphylococcus hyicus]NJH81903.1 2-succinyl-6-hydroxy-2,4-cyclohexadiene-1-carboxylate synthase [Staphylococcus hyicus]PTJ71437.1 2-succinyl-6-hydroxy-2,4-cyclohexadiene-1-carboxylate synthase [Staphylococcus hyicus]PTJ89904.1 2-succinyl-6-hydroxy-2,4-cyclohexadiene-1-carboxylate synthase [Staphylococcus hyicus]RIO45717.1 2-succin